MKTVFIAAIALLTITLTSCIFVNSNHGMGKTVRETASNRFTSRTVEVTGFDAITCNVPADVTYIPGDFAVTLHGPDNVLDATEVNVDNGILTIRFNKKSFRNLKDFDITVSCPELKVLTCNGAVDFDAPRGISTKDFVLDVNGAGDIEIKGLKAETVALTVNGAGDAEIDRLDCDTITVSINGAGDADLSGRAAHAILSVNGAGDIDVSELACPDINTSVKGIGSIKRR